MKPELVILVGNIGSGKTTFCKKLLKKGFSHIIISRDSLRYAIGAGKYRFDEKLEKAIWDIELNMVENFMLLGQNIIIDEIGMSKSMRIRYINLSKIYKYTITVIEMPKLSKKVSVNRRMKNPHQCNNRKLWENVWEKFNNIYEKPIKSEGISKIIKL